MGGYFSEADVRVFGQQQRRKNHGVTVLHLNAALGFRLGEVDPGFGTSRVVGALAVRS